MITLYTNFDRNLRDGAFCPCRFVLERPMLENRLSNRLLTSAHVISRTLIALIKSNVSSLYSTNAFGIAWLKLLDVTKYILWVASEATCNIPSRLFFIAKPHYNILFISLIRFPWSWLFLFHSKPYEKWDAWSASWNTPATLAWFRHASVSFLGLLFLFNHTFRFCWRKAECFDGLDSFLVFGSKNFRAKANFTTLFLQ